MVAAIKSALDDGLFQLQILDMKAGLCTNTGALSLAANQTPDALNVFGFEGRLQFRGGYQLFCNVPFTTDAEMDFIDATGTIHMLVWAGGNIYDCASGSAISIATAVYAAGAQIGVTILNAIIYWCTLNVPLRQYDGVTEAAVTNSGAVGSVPPPAGNFLTVYNGQLVMLQPVVAGTTYTSAFMWCNVNDPTTWIGASIQFVGSKDGGVCQWAIPLGIPALVVAKSLGASRQSLFVYTGALSALSISQTPISCPVGALDPNSAAVVPSKQGLGQIMFLASDAHFWITNGVQAWLASNNILGLTENYIRNAQRLNATQKFFSTYYTRWQYYVCNVGGNFQFVYRPEDEAWWLFQGWPSGPFSNFISLAANKLPALYCAANSGGQTGIFQIAMDQTGDGGNTINAYYTTPYLHGGKIEREKQYQTFALASYNVGVKYDISGYSIPRSDGFIYTMDTLHFADPAVSSPSSSTAIWDVSFWDACLWGGGFSTAGQPYQPCMNHAAIRYTTAGTKWVQAGEKAPLKSAAAQFKIAWAGGITDFQILGYNVRYLERSFGFTGNAPYQTAGGIISTTDSYTTTGAN